MSQTSAPVGDNCKLYSSPDGTTYTALANIESITGNKPKATAVKTTKVDTANNAETSQGGRVDWGEIVAKIRFEKVITGTVLGYMTNKTTLFWKGETNDGPTYTGNVTNSTEVVQGWVMEFDPFGELQENKEIISTITIKVTGSGTFTAGV